MGRDELVELVRDAVERSVDAITRARPRERVSGYALCTDDSVSTLYHVACTAEWVAQRESQYPEIQCVPVDWEHDEGRSYFDDARRELRARYDAADASGTLATHVEHAFEDLVLALELAKQRGSFADAVLLLVTSTDPGPRMIELSIDAARRLNPPDAAARWAHALGE